MTMCWGIKWSSDGNKCDGHPEKMTWRLPKLEWSSTMLYVWKGAHTHTHTRLQTCSIAIRGVLRAFSSMWQDAIKGSPVMRLLGLFRALAVPLLYSPPNHNNPNGLWWAPPSCLSNRCKYCAFEPHPSHHPGRPLPLFLITVGVRG